MWNHVPCSGTPKLSRYWFGVMPMAVEAMNMHSCDSCRQKSILIEIFSLSSCFAVVAGPVEEIVALVRCYPRKQKQDEQTPFPVLLGSKDIAFWLEQWWWIRWEFSVSSDVQEVLVHNSMLPEFRELFPILHRVRARCLCLRSMTTKIHTAHFICSEVIAENPSISWCQLTISV